MKDYFHGLPEDVRPRPIILPLLAWLGCILCVILILAGLSGCATPEPDARICFMQFLGKTGDGLSVVSQYCMTTEQFSEMQK